MRDKALETDESDWKVRNETWKIEVGKLEPKLESFWLKTYC